MLLSFRDIAKAAYAAQQQALVQVGGAAGATWENLSSTAQEGALALVRGILRGNSASGIVLGGQNAYAFNTHVGGAGATVGTTPVTAAATTTFEGFLSLSAATLTGTMEAGDTITIAGIVYTVLAPATAAANAITVYVGADQPVAAIASGTAFTYAAAGANAAHAQYVFNEVVLALSGLMGG